MPDKLLLLSIRENYFTRDDNAQRIVICREPFKNTSEIYKYLEKNKIIKTFHGNSQHYNYLIEIETLEDGVVKEVFSKEVYEDEDLEIKL